MVVKYLLLKQIFWWDVHLLISKQCHVCSSNKTCEGDELDIIIQFEISVVFWIMLEKNMDKFEIHVHIVVALTEVQYIFNKKVSVF